MLEPTIFYLVKFPKRGGNRHEITEFSLVTINPNAYWWKWFAPDQWELQRSFMYHLFDPNQIKVVAQFIMGAHWLNIEL